MKCTILSNVLKPQKPNQNIVGMETVNELSIKCHQSICTTPINTKRNIYSRFIPSQRTYQVM